MTRKVHAGPGCAAAASYILMSLYVYRNITVATHTVFLIIVESLIS